GLEVARERADRIAAQDDLVARHRLRPADVRRDEPREAAAEPEREQHEDGAAQARPRAQRARRLLASALLLRLAEQAHHRLVGGEAQRGGDGAHEAAHEAIGRAVEDARLEPLERSARDARLRGEVVEREAAQLALALEVGADRALGIAAQRSRLSVSSDFLAHGPPGVLVSAVVRCPTARSRSPSAAYSSPR